VKWLAPFTAATSTYTAVPRGIPFSSDNLLKTHVKESRLRCDPSHVLLWK